MIKKKFDEKEYLENIDQKNVFRKRRALLKYRIELLNEIHVNQKLLCRVDETLGKMEQIAKGEKML